MLSPYWYTRNTPRECTYILQLSIPHLLYIELVVTPMAIDRPEQGEDCFSCYVPLSQCTLVPHLGGHNLNVPPKLS